MFGTNPSGSRALLNIAAFVVLFTLISAGFAAELFRSYGLDDVSTLTCLVAAGVFAYQVVPTFILYLFVRKDLADSGDGGH